MAKESFMLAVLCGLISVALADPTMYPAAPATYPAAPSTYPAPPAPPKYETPAVKYEVPAMKYEAPKYEKKMEEYQMKPAAPYSQKPSAPPAYPMKMEYATAKRYRRAAPAAAAEEDVDKTVEEPAEEDPVKASKKTAAPAGAPAGAGKLSKKNVNILRDAVIESLLADPSILGGIFPRFRGGFGLPGFRFGFGDGFMGRPGFDFDGGFRRPFYDDDESDDMRDDRQDPVQGPKKTPAGAPAAAPAGPLAAAPAGAVKLSKKDVNIVRDAVIENLLADPSIFGRIFGRRGLLGSGGAIFGRRGLLGSGGGVFGRRGLLGGIFGRRGLFGDGSRNRFLDDDESDDMDDEQFF